jgi:hypothetical protein
MPQPIRRFDAKAFKRPCFADASTMPAPGADVIFGGAAPFSTSHRNMERVGMRLQFMRSLWTPE